MSAVGMRRDKAVLRKSGAFRSSSSPPAICSSRSPPSRHRRQLSAGRQHCWRPPHRQGDCRMDRRPGVRLFAGRAMGRLVPDIAAGRRDPCRGPRRPRHVRCRWPASARRSDPQRGPRPDAHDLDPGSGPHRALRAPPWSRHDDDVTACGRIHRGDGSRLVRERKMRCSPSPRGSGRPSGLSGRTAFPSMPRSAPWNG